MAKAKTTKRVSGTVAVVRRSNQTERLYRERGKHSDAIWKIDKEIQDLEKETRLKRLAGYIGNYYQGTGYGEHFISIYYVVGISKGTTRSRVLQVTENGETDPWYTYEEQDCIYDMSGKKPCTKVEFDRIIEKIRNRIEGYCA